MRVVQLGSGEPQVAIVGAIHGDEPSGAIAIERLIADPPTLTGSVKLIVANERALEQGARYLETDLNRAFPGDAASERLEDRLAAHLLEELKGHITLALHSTQSFAEPFALVGTVDEIAREIVPHLPVAHLVETGAFSEGRLLPHVNVIEVESGLQGSDQAADNAEAIARAFLAATGVSTDPVGTPRAVEVYRLRTQVAKPPAEEYDVYVDSFERVPPGTVYAKANGRTLTTDDEFYPVLMSAYGYRDIFGYKADRLGALD